MASATSNAPSNPADSPEPEEVLPRQFGKYTLLRLLASGGMAVVYLAIQRSVAGFEKLVVVKRVLPELARDRAFIEMLLAEARTAASLNHPNVVQTFDVGEYEGTYYIALEHINGEDIRSVVRAMKRKGVTEFPLEHALTIIGGVCGGLAYAHEKRDLDGEPLCIVHRDISPQNVLITFTGDVKIVDFGIAKSTQSVTVDETAAGQIKGKVPYMSPEQARGEEIDHRSDIFAVGIMLFELTTGRRLFKAKSDFETLKLICERDYPRPSQVRPGYPEQLEAIVMRALEKDRDKRYQSAREMQADLEAFIREEKIAASTVGMSTWMNYLFEEKIAQQKTVLQDVKQLADVIASNHSSETGEWPGASSTGAATISGRDIPAAEPSAEEPRKSPPYAAIGVAVVALAAVVILFFGRQKETSSLPPAAQPTMAATQQPTETAPKRGSLVITTDPPGAYVRVAGELQGKKTPLTVEKLPLGMDVEVKISKDGFDDHLASVSFDETHLERRLSVKLGRGTATVALDVEPEGALVTLDGQPWKGEGGRIEELSAGEHELVFSAPGHLPQRIELQLEKGETKNLQIRLEAGEPGLSAPSTAPTTAHATAPAPTPPSPAPPAPAATPSASSPSQ